MVMERTAVTGLTMYKWSTAIPCLTWNKKTGSMIIVMERTAVAGLSMYKWSTAIPV